MLDYNMSRDQIELMSRRSKQQRPESMTHVLGSFDLFVDEDDQSVARWLMSDGFWESWITSWFTKVLEPDWNCLDVGASFGYYTGVCATLAPEGKTVAIEANPKTADLVSKSIIWNGWQDRVSVLSAAASNKYGTASLHVPGSNQGSASIMRTFGDDYPSFAVEVPTIPLDSRLDDDFDFIKFDIEGAEPLAMEGMVGILSNNPLIAIEVVGTQTDFINYLFDVYDVTEIGTNGDEMVVTRADIHKKVWAMLVLRSK